MKIDHLIEELIASPEEEEKYKLFVEGMYYFQQNLLDRLKSDVDIHISKLMLKKVKLNISCSARAAFTFKYQAHTYILKFWHYTRLSAGMGVSSANLMQLREGDVVQHPLDHKRCEKHQNIPSDEFKEWQTITDLEHWLDEMLDECLIIAGSWQWDPDEN